MKDESTKRVVSGIEKKLRKSFKNSTKKKYFLLFLIYKLGLDGGVVDDAAPHSPENMRILRRTALKNNKSREP